MTSLNFVEYVEYAIQKVVTAGNTYESDVAPSESDNKFKTKSLLETSLLNLVKVGSSNNKNDNLNSLQTNKNKKTQGDYKWRSMKERTSITRNSNFSDNGMSDIEELKVVIDYLKISLLMKCSSILHIIQIYTVFSKILPKVGLQHKKMK